MNHTEEHLNNFQQDKPKFIADLVGDQYKHWANEIILFDADTGTGKTYFILNILAPYIAKANKKMLYLCNRRTLREEIQSEVNAMSHDHVDVFSYQIFQKKVKAKHEFEAYDYIIIDEAHYFTSDSFNLYTDVSYYNLMRQSNSVRILMSATAKPLFNYLRQNNLVRDDCYYCIAKDYSYVNNVVLYNAAALTTWIDDIRTSRPDEKILVFCNSAKRILEMHNVYGDDADYFCSTGFGKNKNLEKICTQDVIKYHMDGRATFDKPILFTTKVLDNGINLKDTAIKHIFTEIFDVDSMIQSLGRKRPFNHEDLCTFYIKNYKKQAVNYFLKINSKQLDPANLFINNTDAFHLEYGNGKKRRELSSLKCFYIDIEDMSNANDNCVTAFLRLNNLMYEKSRIEQNVIYQILVHGYAKAVTFWLGDELANKVIVSKSSPNKKARLRKYLSSNRLRCLYKPEQEALKNEFRKAGLSNRSMGIRKLNGILEHEQLPYIINNTRDRRRVLDDGTINPYRDSTYWMIEEFDEDACNVGQ